MIQSVSYWSEFRKSEGRARSSEKAAYRKPYFYALVFGVLCMWVAWLGGMTLLALNRCESVFGWRAFQSHSALWSQISGFVVFYLGAVTYNLTLFAAGKYLRPAPSGIHEEHGLIQEGPYRAIRHPLYVSYVLIWHLSGGESRRRGAGRAIWRGVHGVQAQSGHALSKVVVNRRVRLGSGRVVSPLNEGCPTRRS